MDTPNIVDNIPRVYGISPKGSHGTWDKETRAMVYATKITSSDDPRDIFRPHTVKQYKEDAPCIVMAHLDGGVRRRSNVLAVTGLGIDVDKGVTLDQLKAKLANAPSHLIYSSYNHQASFTIIPLIEVKYERDDTECNESTGTIVKSYGGPAFREKALAFMSFMRTRDKFRGVPTSEIPEFHTMSADDFWQWREERNLHWKSPAGLKAEVDALLPDVRALIGDATEDELSNMTISVHRQVIERRGSRASVIQYGIRATHKPVIGRNKFRVIFLLRTPFIGPNDEWRGRRIAFTKSIGLAPFEDKKTLDPTRAFFGAAVNISSWDEKTLVYEYFDRGKLLDIYAFHPPAEDDTELDDVEPLDDEEAEKALTLAIVRLNAIPDDEEFLRAFYRQFPRSFLIRRFMKSVCPSIIEGHSDSVEEVRCPSSHFHGSRAMKDGAYVMDATDTGKGFKWGCQHAHSGAPEGMKFTTVDMMCEAMRLGWFTRSDLLSSIKHFDQHALRKDLVS